MNNNSDTLATIAARFKEARLARNMDQKDVAEKAGVSVGTINNLEHGRRMPHRRTRAAISRALGEDIFEDGLGDEARLGWPQDVQVFADVIGGYLAALPPTERAEVVGRWMREITGQSSQ
jgi:transcriptional regulator with XRE-family HTH domain